MVSVSENKSALLVLDYQNNILSNFSNKDQLIATVQSAIECGRKLNLPIIYSKVKFREGYPEISPNNKTFTIIKNVKPTEFADDQITEIHEALTPQKGEFVVVKRRFSAFMGSDLEVILRGLQINHLIIAGISTSGVILSTVREAADKDYKMTLLSDCCMDQDQEVHDVLMKKILTRTCDVITVNEWRNASLTNLK